MEYWIVGGIGAVIVIALGIFLNLWDRKRYEATKENTKENDKK